MSIHKLTAGNGYDYLTRQVAAMDATDKGHAGLASYYTEKGETPGQWVGSGMAGIERLATGEMVTAEQMKALFGSGLHPLAAERQAQVIADFSAEMRASVTVPVTGGRRSRGRPRHTVTQQELQHRLADAARLGRPFGVHDGGVSAFRREVASRFADFNATAGLPGDWAVPADERARIRTQVAREFFRAEHGRDPADAREIAATIARHSRPSSTAVAGFDLTFSPVKSFSVLWALADPATAARLEQAHRAAVSDALAFLEAHALFTRTGRDGIRQVEVRGLVAAAFTHRDSRAGDPDLHTHVAVANKVQTTDGRWLAIDARVLFKANVTASEVYNTALETHCAKLGLRFAAHSHPDTRKRPVREVVGVDERLLERFSKRRVSIEHRRDALAVQFQQAHGRPATAVEMLKLDQQATLETRQAKHPLRSLAEQRAAWHTEATDLLGGDRRLRRMLRDAFRPVAMARQRVDSACVAAATDRVLSAMETRRATWQEWHVRAEALRQVRGLELPIADLDRLVDLLVDQVLTDRSIPIAPPTKDDIAEPRQLRRRDGASVYNVPGAELFTSARILAAERELVAAAGRTDGRRVPHAEIEAALRETAATGLVLNQRQAELVRQMAGSGARVQLAIAPAGSGKTTAMRALAAAWTAGGGEMIGLAPSAAAADQLAASLRGHSEPRPDAGPSVGTGEAPNHGAGTGPRTETLAKLTHSLATETGPEWIAGIGPQSLVVIDEAGMADTLSLATTVRYVTARGGSVRLIGDDRQLAAIGAGGVLRDIASTHDALELSELVRFADPAEAAASIALREGKPEALGFYLDHGRVHVGDLATLTKDVFAAWATDQNAGADAIMLAPTRALVAELNQRARAHRLNALAHGGAGAGKAGRERVLADGNTSSAGDLVITRTNDRRLRTSPTDWVKNGDRWFVRKVHDDGALTVQHTRGRRTVRLPADYVEQSTELGYATTIHTAQGVTAQTMHGLVTGQESRQQLYTMLTRGKTANHLYLQVVGDGDPHSLIRPETTHPVTATEMLEQMLTHDDAAISATTLIQHQADLAPRLADATTRYLDALYVAAETTLGLDVGCRLDQAAEELIDGLTDAPAWPALRAHLLLIAATGHDPLQALSTAARGELDTAHDPAAVLDWRLDDTGMRDANPGPLPWVPGVPAALAQDPQWDDYLAQRAELVTSLADQLRDDVLTTAGDTGRSPTWLTFGMTTDPEALADIEVWRAAVSVDPEDTRPTGAPQLQKAAATWQRQLNHRLGGRTPALDEWGPLLQDLAPQTAQDDFTPQLADRLAGLHRAGLPAADFAREAAAQRPLPDDHAAAALWWRITAQCEPATISESSQRPAEGDWRPQLSDHLGADVADRLESSPAWPTLASLIDDGIQHGWRIVDLLLPVPRHQDASGFEAMDECEAILWRIGSLLRLHPAEGADDEPLPDYEPELQSGPTPPVRGNPDPRPTVLANQPRWVRTWIPESGIDEPAIPALARHQEPPPLRSQPQDRPGPRLSR
jgi:conjugative relaxase-like TrwC/TraI family protein